MLQDSSGEDPFHLTQQTQEGCFRTPVERILSSVLTQQTQEGCFRTPEERILSICADSADSGRMLQDSRGEDPFHLC
ncbi:hypothetical protein CgunFtcFv8_010137 [Champsocephalus gunnari]|uniref:Uncharacterized protein n=1 Tax=Champsocephalus gunnari TaxID=52237 RepID=A0AAN8HUX4_CHAGU|nr:hypothetical protein CgunFtcFv8_010137 [Champsocephalus gunnari]